MPDLLDRLKTALADRYAIEREIVPSVWRSLAPVVLSPYLSPMPEITARLSIALADRYKIESHLGEGGMANVYLAKIIVHGGSQR